MKARLGFVLKGYPRLSETFIAQEIANLERRGFAIDIFSLRHPTDKSRHPVHEQIKAPVTYLPEYLHDEPGRVLKAWQKVRCLPGYGPAREVFTRDLARDATRNRVRRFGQAMVLAAEAPKEVTHFHAHFLHTPASVARYAAMITGRHWSFSAHAKDIWTIADWEKREKLEDAAFGVTCTRAGTDHLNCLGTPAKSPVALMYHGIDLTRFVPSAEQRQAEDPFRIISVGRAVAKKGYDDLLTALEGLPRDLNWTFDHIGGGPLLKGLKSRTAHGPHASRIIWRGARPQDDVIDLIGTGDLFVLASHNQNDGDRDGIPNVLLEAMAMGLPVVASDAGAIAELIKDGETGVLVPAGDSAALADAITALARDPERRAALAAAGQRRVRAGFDAERWADDLAQFFARMVPGAAP
jgi:glycosyltransferase involved in cell wall biosynthesis